MNVPRTAALLLALAPILVAAPAFAQARKPAPPAAPAAPTAPPSLADSLTGDAKASYDSAKLLYADGDFEGSRVKFAAAFDQAKDPRLLWNMAACEKSLRHYARALKLVRRYAAEGGALLTDQDRAEAAELIKVMDPLTAKLVVRVSEPGADVAIDDEAIGQSPLPTTVVDLGTRRVRVKKALFDEVTREVPVGGAPEITVDIVLVRTVHEGRVIVSAEPGDVITLDGTIMGAGSWSGDVTSGNHTLRVTNPNKLPYEAEIIVADKQVREVRVTLKTPPSGGLPIWAWVAGGAVIVTGMTVGGYFLFRKTDPVYDGPHGNLDPGIIQASHPIRF